MEVAEHHRKAWVVAEVHHLKALEGEEVASLGRESWASRCSPWPTWGEAAPWYRRESKQGASHYHRRWVGLLLPRRHWIRLQTNRRHLMASRGSDQQAEGQAEWSCWRLLLAWRGKGCNPSWPQAMQQED